MARLCNHRSSRSPFKGMRRQGLTPDELYVLYLCPTCGAKYLADRCVEILDSGRRCYNAALTNRTICIAHLMAMPEDTTAVPG